MVHLDISIKSNLKMIELAEDNLQEIVNENELVMVQYGATWCGNCKITKPKFKRLAGETENIKFIYDPQPVDFDTPTETYSHTILNPFCR